MGGLPSSCLKSACCCDSHLGVWEADATDFGLEELKKRLEGQRRKAKTNPDTEPEIYVTFLEVAKKDDGSIRFSPERFVLKDLMFQVEVEIRGTSGQLAHRAAAKGADVAMLKAGVNEDRRQSVTSTMSKAAEKVLNTHDKARDMLGLHKVQEKMGIKSKDVRTLKVGITLDLTKEFSADEVAVKLKDLETDHSLLQKVLSLDLLRRHIERTISEKATEITTRLLREKAEELKKQMPVAASALGY